MLNKLHIKSLLLLLMMFVGGNAWANEETITFSELDLTNGTQYTDPFTSGAVSVTFAGGSNDGKYYSTGTGIRTYGDGTITIEASGKEITAIALTFSGDGYAPTDATVWSCTGGSGTGTKGADASWSGSATKVVLTRPSGSGHWRLQKVVVTYTAAAEGQSDSPVITGEDDFYNTTLVTITAAEGASIYYTTDGTDPTTSSTEYTAAFELSATTTVKAIAVESGKEASAVVEKTFTKGTSYANLAALVTAGSKGYVQLTDALVTYVTGNHAYMEDATGGIYLFGCKGDLAAGDKITGVMYVTGYSLYNALPEVTAYTLLDGYTKTSGNEVTPTDLTIEDLYANYTRYLSCYVKIVDAEVTSAFSSKSAIIEQNGFTITLRDQNSTATLEVSEGVTVTVTGHPSIYNDEQFALWEQSQIVVTSAVATDPEVSFAKDSETLELDEEFTNTLTAPSALTITYSSSDDAVASVDASTGAVTAHAVGTANITASWEATVEYNAGSVSYAVTVVEELPKTIFKPVTSTRQLVADNEYILVVPDDTAPVAMGAVFSTSSAELRSAVDVVINESGNVEIKKEAVAVLTLGGESDAWTFKASDNDKYLALASNANALNSSTDASAATSLWKVTSDYRLQTDAYSDNTRYLHYNSTNPRFACYKTGQTAAYLYMKEGGAETGSETAVLEISETMLLVEGTATISVTNVDGLTVSYASDATAIATVSDAGVVTGVAPGTANITATWDEQVVEGVTVLAGTKTFTVTVVGVEDGIFDFTQNLIDYSSGLTPTNDGSEYVTEATEWTADNVTLTTSGKYRWWQSTNSFDLRIYKTDDAADASSLLLSVPRGYAITKITVNGTNTTFTANVGTYESGVWTGESQNVVLTYALESGSMTIKTISVEYTTQTVIAGDVDGNGVLEVADLEYLVRYLTGHETDEKNCDVDGVSGVSLGDLTTLVNILREAGVL